MFTSPRARETTLPGQREVLSLVRRATSVFCPGSRAFFLERPQKVAERAPLAITRRSDTPTITR
jgi:hypothetical protein